MPLLYVYEGGGCTGLANLPKFRAMLGRQEDGIVDFNDFTETRANAALNADWALGCWKGHVANVAYSVGLAFSNTTTAEVAAGLADAQYAHIGASLVSHGFPKAYVRLGWEMNGGWYPWGQKGATYVAAFNHVAPIIKARCPDCTIVFNPSAGIDPTREFPGPVNIGAMGWDDYVNSWNSGGAKDEPGLFAGDNAGPYWSFQSGYTSYSKNYYASLGSGPIVPEFGVGSRSDGHGACTGKTATACDDPYAMTAALSAFSAGGVKLVGYWDYNAGDYNSKISDGSRPHQALAFINVYGSAGMKAIFNAEALPFTTQTPPTVTCSSCHAAVIQNGPNHWMICILALDAHPSATVTWGKSTNANLYDPNSASPATPIRALRAATSWTGVLSPGKPLVIGLLQ
jgi:hypothetical protein